MKSPLSAVAAAFKELARVLRIAASGGRRVQRFEIEQRWNWVRSTFGLNRHERRKYLALLRKKK